MGIHGIGELLLNIREKRGLSQRELSLGLCEGRELSKIETGNKVPDTFLLDALMSRLGKTADKLEYIVSEKDYHFWVRRAAIERALEKKQYKKVEKKLSQYEKALGEQNVLHFQYLDMIRAFLLWEDAKKEEDCIYWLESAMDRTLPFWRKEGVWNHAVSWLEAGLFLLWTMKSKTEREKTAFLEEMLHYIEKQWEDEEEKMKILPLAAIFYSRILIKEGRLEKAADLCREAIGLLARCSSITNLLVLLKLRITAFERIKEAGGKAEELERLIKQREALEAVEREYHYHEAEIEVFTRVKRELYLDREILVKNRKAMGLTQEIVSEGICARETLARIERGRIVRDKNFKKLAERISWKKEKRANEIECWDYEVLQKKYEIDWLLARYQYEEARERLEEFPYPATAEGRQYVLYITTMIEMETGKKSPEEGKDLLEEALALTLECEDLERVKGFILTKQEVMILNGIAVAYAKMGKKEYSVKIYKDILESYKQSKVFPVFRAYGLLVVLGNLALYLEEINCFEEALEQLRRKLKLELYCRRIGRIEEILLDMAYTLERKGSEAEKRKLMYIQAYYLSDLVQETMIKEITALHFREVYEYEITV